MTTTGPFDLLAALPEGPTTTVLEASAGTGKTYALAGLVTRYVAEGAAQLDEMLLITFGRAASQELRERVRAQLTDAERALADPAAYSCGTSVVCGLPTTLVAISSAVARVNGGASAEPPKRSR